MSGLGSKLFDPPSWISFFDSKNVTGLVAVPVSNLARRIGGFLVKRRKMSSYAVVGCFSFFF